MDLLPLCLDGGGMRGLVSVVSLFYISNNCLKVSLLFASKRLLGDESLPNYFDWLIGTSTGSMLALSVASGRSLSDCFHLYWNMKRQIFLEGSTMSRLLGDQVPFCNCSHSHNCRCNSKQRISKRFYWIAFLPKPSTRLNVGWLFQHWISLARQQSFIYLG